MCGSKSTLMPRWENQAHTSITVFMRGSNDYRLIIALYVFSVSYNRQSTEQDFLNFIKQNYSFFELFYLFIILNLAFLKFSMFSLY